ncbi:hypothetical protein L7F22_058421 [Adiantum nelumboides]|nr:hypothetical protein [Adiantum nelumboides]
MNGKRGIEGYDQETVGCFWARCGLWLPTSFYINLIVNSRQEMSSPKEGGTKGIISKMATFSIGKSGPSNEEDELQRRKTFLQRRSAVSAEVTSLQEIESFCPKIVAKSEEAKQRIQQALKDNYLFKYLDPEQAQIVIDAVEEVKFNNDEIVIKQGDPGDHFYLLEEGTCEVWLQRPDKGEADMVKEYSAGDSFGELALLYNAPRAATVKASSNCTLWAMDRMTFRAILLHTTSQKRQLYEKFLDDVPLFKTLDKYEKAAIADVLEAEYFEEGLEILVEGHPGEKFYLLEEGEAEAKTRGNVVKKYKRGDYFGELALLNDKPRAATVVAVTKCKCVSIDRRSFKRLFGKLDDILKRNTREYDAGTSKA